MSGGAPVAVRLDVDAGVATIELVRGDTGNPIDADFCRELRAAVDTIGVRDDVRVAVIRTSGRFFSVGGDLTAFLADRDDLPRLVREATVDVGAAMARLARLPVPVVVEVQGQAVGGAISLVAVADVAIAGESATFYGAFNRIGLSPDMGSTTFVTRRVGSRHATNLYLLNQTWTAPQAAERGLVSVVVPDDELRSTADETVGALAAGPTRAMAATRQLLWRAAERSLEEQLEAEADSITVLARTDDAWEGFNAVMDRRPPHFTGR
jgi:2-(1,2-epoxy-1,2-dihydrophenyl)acetyl-CoA isomerase